MSLIDNLRIHPTGHRAPNLLERLNVPATTSVVTNMEMVKPVAFSDLREYRMVAQFEHFFKIPENAPNARFELAKNAGYRSIALHCFPDMQRHLHRARSAVMDGDANTIMKMLDIIENDIFGGKI